jgi:hypothetical protein
MCKLTENHFPIFMNTNVHHQNDRFFQEQKMVINLSPSPIPFQKTSQSSSPAEAWNEDIF